MLNADYLFSIFCYLYTYEIPNNKLFKINLNRNVYIYYKNGTY